MAIKHRAGLAPAVACLLVGLFPLGAAAQTPDSLGAAQAPDLVGAAAQAAGLAQITSGPMVVQRVKSGWLVAPDFKITDFDGKASGLAGAYGGWLADETFLVGAGAYWLTDTSHDRDMWYFGLVTGVYVHRDRPVGFGFKGLIGGGEATLAQQVTYLQPSFPRGQPPIPVTTTQRYHTDFFIFEPEANVLVHLNPYLKVTGGVGYRLTSDYHSYYGYGYYGYDNRLHGITGSIALQIGGGGS